MSEAISPNVAGPQKLPVATVAMALTAMGALYVTSKGYAGLAPLAVALVATYSTNLRLKPSPFLAWAIRVIVFGTILVTANPDRRVDAGSMVFDPGYTNLFGFLCAAELVIRAWVRRRGGPSKGETLFLSVLVFAAATNAGDLRSVWWVRTLAPVFLALLVMTLRRFRDRPAGAGVGWIGALLVALAIGATSSWAVTEFEGQITRWSMKFLSDRRGPSSSIGLGRTATLGRVFNPHPSAKRVMKIEGWPGERHMRAVAFEQYADGTWGPAVDQREFGAPGDLSGGGKPGREVRVTRYGDAFGLLCVPLEAIGVHVPAEEVELQQDATGAIKAAGDRVPDPLTYTLTVGNDGAQGVVARTLSDDTRRWDLVVPKDIDPRVAQIARDVAKGDDREKLARITIYLQANHHYSLEVDPGDGDPISAFLLKKLDGHCEYFAASVVVMARCVGIPARFASGYYAHERAGDGVTVVRDRDAHAWAECWVDGTGWVTVDATPAGGRPDALFTETPAWRTWWERTQDLFAAIRAWLGRRTLLEGAAMIAILAAIPVFIRIWKGRGERRRRHVEEGYGPPSSRELADIGKRFERALRRRGIEVKANRTWAETAGNVEGGAEFVRAYNALRFGGEGNVARLGEMVRRMEV